MEEDKKLVKLSFEGEISLKYEEIDKLAEKVSKKIDIPKEKAKLAIEMGIFEGFLMNRYRKIDLEEKEKE
jgi:hypothetical protein